MQAVSDFIRVVVQVQYDVVGLAEGDDLAEHVRLNVQLFRRLLATRVTHGRSQRAAAQFRQPRDHQLGIFENLAVLLPVPHGRAERCSQHRQLMLLRQLADARHGIVR